MNFFEQIMSPFIFVIEQILLFSYELTANYGWSIILLSFAISLLLLPVFIYIEKSKKKDDVVKKKMQPLIDEIKRVYKGQERYYYIKTINRQYNYSSFKALIPILSLLLQIPFFIAAYQFLEHYEPLKEVSFWFINDLSQPDALFGVVNFLPILMTIVNLITVYFYTINGDGSERKQMLILAGVFLVLLFNLPSGLVLYWTMNNVFSFLRLFITNPEVFKNKKTLVFPNIKTDFISLFPKLKLVFTILLLLLLGSQFYWAIEHDFNDIYFRVAAVFVVSIILSLLLGFLFIIYQKYKHLFSKISVAPQVFLSILFLSIYFYLASKFYFTGENISLGILAILFLLPTQFLGYLYVLKSSKKINSFIYESANIALFVLFVYQLILTNTYFTDNEISISIAKFNIITRVASLTDILGPGIIFSLITLGYYLKQKTIKIAHTDKSQWLILSLSAFYITGFIFLWNPLNIYSTFPESFVFPAVEILKNNIILFGFSWAAFIIIYALFPKKLKALWMILVLTLAAVSFLHNTVIPIEMGSLQETKFLFQDNLAQPLIMYIIEGFALIVIFIIISYLIEKKYFKQIVISLLLLNTVLISQSIVASVKTGTFWKLPKINMDASSAISFSKDKENIVFFVADMFQGWYMKEILENEPELRKELSGFVWYPNTLSVSSITSSSMPPIIGGYDYTIDKLNKDETHTLNEKMTKITEEFYDRIKQKGYSYTSTDMIYSKIDKNKFDSYLPKWTEKWDRWNKTLQIDGAVEIGYEILWKNAAFYSLPLFLKPELYDKGRWIKSNENINENTNSAKKYNFMRLMPYISNNENDKPSFTYIHTMASHQPWDVISDDGIVHNDVSPYENNKWVLKTFIKWINWMKENEVYDNTKIIFLSDHGIHWIHFKGEMDDTMPIKNINSMYSEDYSPWVKKTYPQLIKGMFPVLLVKDFNKKKPLQEDNRFMSNADASYIAFDEENPTTVEPPKKRVLPSSMVVWIRKVGLQKNIPTIYNVEATNTAYDLKNWKRIK